MSEPNMKYCTEIVKITDEWLQSKYVREHNRLKTFAFKGVVCVTCGKVGTHVIKWYQSKEYMEKKIGLHVDVIGYNEYNHVFLMTSDHIHPKSKGGSDNILNRQPMCLKCNSLKADKIDEKASILSIDK